MQRFFVNKKNSGVGSQNTDGEKTSGPPLAPCGTAKIVYRSNLPDHKPTKKCLAFTPMTRLL